MPARIILVRHGQTEWNRVERFRGRTEITLDDTGLAQAEATGARLSQMGLSAIYSSPLTRAMQTAEAIARQCGLAVAPFLDIIDVDYGAWQGLTLAQAQQYDPQAFAEWRHHPESARFPGGESLEEVRRRGQRAIDSILPRHADQTVALVTHVAVCRMLALHLLDVDSSHFWNVLLDNCGVSIFEMRNGIPVATTINDTCHLERHQH